jgi:predicted PurR-regulated permease PerM
VYLIIPPVVSELGFLKNNLPQYNQEIHQRLGFILPANYNLSDLVTRLASGITGEGGVLAKTFVFFNSVLSFIAVLVISIYLVAEEKGMKSFVSTLIPARHQEFTMNLIDKIQKKMGLWVIGQVIICFGIFLFTFIGLLILHVKYALFLALLAGLFELVPYIGPFLSAIPAVIFAFIQHPPLVIAVIILYILVHEVEGYVLVPKIMQKTVGTSPLVVLIALLIGLKLAGVVGVLISVPLATALTIVISEFYSLRNTAG